MTTRDEHPTRPDSRRPEIHWRLVKCDECKNPVSLPENFVPLCPVCVAHIKAERGRQTRSQSIKYITKLEVDRRELIRVMRKCVDRLRNQGPYISSETFSSNLDIIGEAEKIAMLAETNCAFPKLHPQGCICLVQT